LELAQSLIHSLAARFEPEKYRDTYRERLEALIAAKVQGRATAAPKTAPRETKVLDMAEALRRSLANLKKPASSEKPKKTSRSAGHR
jgi:DNA end-binding protein Ku